MDRELLQKVDALLEKVSQGRIHASLIGMTPEERDAIQQLLDSHYSGLKALRGRAAAMGTVAAPIDARQAAQL